MRFLNRYATLMLFIFCGFVSAAPAEPAPPPIETFFHQTSLTGAELSPNGHYAALRIANTDSRAVLVVLDLDTMTPTPVASFSDRDIGRFRWVNDERLIFNLAEFNVAQADMRGAPGLFAVNRDGSKFRQLVESHRHFIRGPGEAELLPWNTYLLEGVGKQDTNDVFIIKYTGFGKHVDTSTELQRLDTLNGHTETLDTPLHSMRWLIDLDGTPRITETAEGKMLAVHYNDPATGKWRKLAEFEALSDKGLIPINYGPDKTLYVTSNNGKDKEAIYRYDLEHNQLVPTPVVSSDSYDIKGRLLFDQKKLLGVRYSIDAEVTQWFDRNLAAAQKDVDALLPNTTNDLLPSQRSETASLIVNAYSDVQPGTYYIYNMSTKKLTKLGSTLPGVNPKLMAFKDMVHYKARDGLDIPAYLTLPTGPVKKNLPMVVLVHGGPWARGGGWYWDPQAQFLASRGYAVLEPEFRGSTGFGMKHFKAGWKQWGLGMQNDVADGTRWAIGEGIADPKRICIAGASYGGYAALMGLINDSDLYRCGFEWAGVTDISLMYNVSWSDSSDIYKEYGMPILIGDPEKDAAQFKATSPLEQAARIKQPLLLAYGGYDERVPLVHGEKLYDAVKAGNPNVEWVVYKEEGHGWASIKNQVDFWGRVEKFLARNIGTP